MEPSRDANGLLRPDMDFRHVPAHVMAVYLGINPKTLWKRRVKHPGLYPKKAIVLIGTMTCYIPAVMVGAVKQAV